MIAGDRAVHVIKEALRLIPTIQQWAGSADALDKGGKHCSSNDPEAASFGACGSLMGAAYRIHKEYTPATTAYSAAIDFIEHRLGKRVDLNELSYPQTVALFEKVISRA